MTLGLLLALGATVGWIALDVVRKHLAVRMPATHIVIVLTLGALPGFVAWSVLAGSAVHDVAYAAPAAGVIALNLVANVLFMRALELAPLSVTIPLLSFTPVFTALVANPVLGELPSRPQLLGVGAVVGGALLLGVNDATGRARPRPLWRERGALYMVLVALCWSTALVLDKRALAHADIEVHAAIVDGGIGLCLLAWLAVRGQLRTLAAARAHAPALASGVLLSAAALTLQLAAISVLLVSVVETIKRAIELAAAIIIGRLVYGEPLTVPKLLGGALMAVGTALLVAGDVALAWLLRPRASG